MGQPFVKYVIDYLREKSPIISVKEGRKHQGLLQKARGQENEESSTSTTKKRER